MPTYAELTLALSMRVVIFAAMSVRSLGVSEEEDAMMCVRRGAEQAGRSVLWNRRPCNRAGRKEAHSHTLPRSLY